MTVIPNVLRPGDPTGLTLRVNRGSANPVYYAGYRVTAGRKTRYRLRSLKTGDLALACRRRNAFYKQLLAAGATVSGKRGPKPKRP